jgi:aminoglycoside/choline kinase family phosphotransferase
MNTRLQTLHDWLRTQCQLTDYQLDAMPGDASFRRYYRLQQGAQSYIVMDAPPELESCKSFIAISRELRKKNLCLPEVIAADVPAGFLLLTDFGDRLYLKELNASNAETLYGHALDALSVMQSCRTVADWTLPLFTADFMYQELQNFKEWFLLRYLKYEISPPVETMLATFFHFLAESAACQPQVFMHRDYHSANLMVLPQSQVGILDFQDAFMGPVTYDLVSLLRDCYIDWPETTVTQLVLAYKEKLNDMKSISHELFLRWFDLMGLQRHLKALLTFSRKYCRDNNSHYLQHIPRTINYIGAVSARYPECREFYKFFEKVVAVCEP